MPDLFNLSSAAALLGSTSPTSLSIGLGGDLLSGWYSAQAAQSALGAANSAMVVAAQANGGLPGHSDSVSLSANAANIVPPWDVRRQQPTPDQRLTEALGSPSIVNESATKLSNPNATASEQKLFTLYNALADLAAIASNASANTTPEIRLHSLNTQFQRDLDQVLSYASSIQGSDIAVIAGKQSVSMTMSTAIPQQLSTYTTKIFQRALPTDPVPGLNGSSQFTIGVTKGGVTTNIAIDLADTGQANPSLKDVVDLVNAQLKAAGMKTTVSTQRIYQKNADGSDPSPLPQTWGLKINGLSTEKLTFSAPGAGTAVYIAGTSGAPSESTAQMLKIDASGATPTLTTSARIEADDGHSGDAAAKTQALIDAAAAAVKDPKSASAAATPSSTGTPASSTPDTATTTAGDSAIDANGNVYVVGTTDGSIGGNVLQGTSDVYLSKYDSTGQVIWQRQLGAATTAQGASVAIDASGNVVIAGTVQGGVNGSDTNKSNNAFVTKYTSEGQEVFTRDVGPMSDDGATSVAFGADGSIYFGGHGTGSLASGATSAGGSDAFITKLTSKGNLVYTRQFGTSGNDTITNLQVDSDGNLVALAMEGNNAVVSKFNSADATSPAIWTQDLGDLGGGQAGALSIDTSTGTVYAGGSTAQSGIGGGTVMGAYQGGSDGFLVALDSATGTAQTTTYVGSASTDRIKSIAAANGDVYIAGDTTGSLGGATFTGSVDGFAAKLDTSTGGLDWVYQYSGRSGQAHATAINVDPQGSSVLDALGLPKGTLDYSQATTITAHSTARAGDYFYLQVDGGAKRKITIDQNETLNSLSNKINNVLVTNGKAAVSIVSGGHSLRITANPGARIDIIAGKDGEDALAGLGLPEGTLIDTTNGNANKPKPPTDPVLKKILADSSSANGAADPVYVALSLSSGMSIGTRGDAASVAKALQSALVNIRNAFRTLTTPPPSDTGPGKKGTAPAYLTAQIANYQAGLTRLTAGGSGSSSVAALI